ncbi:MAG: Asp-tRNA(Asn)/Glu-tRNA(Gln) amidotransferase subunit GatC [Pseudogulbenkiania sp.]|nr:Asp-tRNA(Asn)/Glu-tRNA(Gln) amidotransferase subunit GatC [Pseudogulbenkiania sp.]
MSLTHQDVARIAKLARIAVTDAEIEAVGAQLNNIFGLIAQMQAVDTDGIEPMAHPQDVSLRLRDDVVTESDRREAFQAIAPQVENGLFLVPKVIE